MGMTEIIILICVSVGVISFGVILTTVIIKLIDTLMGLAALRRFMDIFGDWYADFVEDIKEMFE